MDYLPLVLDPHASPALHAPPRRPGAAQTCVAKQDHGLDTGLDPYLIQVGGWAGLVF